MPISDRHRCIFVHIPKTGGTSVEHALGIHGDWRCENRERMFGRIESRSIRIHRFPSDFLQHLTFAQIQKLVPAETIRGYFSFAVVRNPWDRMVSTYSNPDPHLVEKAQAAGIGLSGLAFPAFVRAVDAFEHIHLLAQHEFICDNRGRLLVDLVVRFESLTEGFAEVSRKLSIAGGLGHYNPSKREQYRAYYDKESRRIVARKYRGDIELFGYEF